MGLWQRIYDDTITVYFSRSFASIMRTIDRRVWSNAQSHLICPKRGFCDFPIDSHGRSSDLREEVKKYCTRTDRVESEQNCSLQSAALILGPWDHRNHLDLHQIGR